MRHSIFKHILFGMLMLTAALAAAQSPVLCIDADRILLDDSEVKLLGLRCSNALISNESTDRLIAQLDTCQAVGLNTVSVYIMGSRFGDVKGFLPDGSLDPVVAKRLERILKELQRRRMMAIVGCLYWGTSRAKEDLNGWDQTDANRAVAHTAEWLEKNGFRNVILDPDNEGMACRDNGWSAEQMIDAAHRASPDLPVANNTRQNPPNEDINIHFGKFEPGKPWLDSESTPTNAPGNYWGRFSKETHSENRDYLNYSRIGRYTEEMKNEQLRLTTEGMEKYNGNLLASTWLQCSPHEGADGPFVTFGGYSDLGSSENKKAPWNLKIDTLHPDAGIQWWIDYVRRNF